MTKVSGGEALRVAYQSAVAYGGGVLAEQFIAGEEYTVAILGDRALPSIRIEVPGDFYDFDAKYLSEETRVHLPLRSVASGRSRAGRVGAGSLSVGRVSGLGAALT